MPYTLNNITVDTEAYLDDYTLECPGTVQLNILVANAAVYCQYTIRRQGLSTGALQWSDEVFLIPGKYGRARRADSVRVRAANAGAETAAQVSIEAATFSEVSRP